jgi:arabinofuranosyltransferase
LVIRKAFRQRCSDGLARRSAEPVFDARLSVGDGATEPRVSSVARRDALLWLVVLLFTLSVLRRAWMCDDAFIMMRSVDNLVDGRGFVFNADERVLGLTNPLWALLVAVVYSYIRNPYLTPVFLGVLISAAAATLLVARATHDKRAAALVVVALCFSRAFVDFSTSGLENSLTHLLLAAYFYVVLRPRGAWLIKLSGLAALACVNRPDLAVLVAPPLVAAWWRLRRTGATKTILLGLAPAIVWFGFALVYYGFPLPNTVYAKLNANIPTRELAQQGLTYLIDTVINDPMTAVIVVSALALLAVQGRRDHVAPVILVSMILDLVHVVIIDGDFMSGRFLTPSIAVAAVVLSHYGAQLLGDSSHLKWVAAGVAGIVLSSSFSPFRDDPVHEKREVPRHLVANERAFYQEHLALLVNLRPAGWREDGYFTDGWRVREKHQKVAVAGNLGMFSWGAGPNVHVVDDQALTDPLLARIPFRYSADWRTGHLGRAVPEGYLDTLEHGKNQLKDPCLARYYDQLSRVIRGPLFRWERWKAIAWLNSPEGITVRSCPGGGQQETAAVAQR